MIKLKKLIKESSPGFTKREFGDPLPTFEEVMEKHQTNESGILYRAGVKKYGKEGMRKIQQAAGKRKSHAVIGAIKDKYEKKKKESVDEAEMVLRHKGGKLVNFKNKDNYDKAKKSGDYEKPEDKKAGDDKDAGLGGGDFERETEPERGEKPKAKRSDRYKDVDTSWQDDPDAVAAQGQQGMQPGQAEPTEPKDEVGGIKYGQGFSSDSEHMFDTVADSASSASDKYSGMLDAVKDGNWEKFKAGISDIDDEDAREHLLNLANHVDSGTYNDEFPKGKKGLKFGRKEVMDLFRQAADYGDDQFGNESITINGKKYRPITESIKPTIFDPLTEAKKQLGDLYTRMKDK
jgi:hypothetical protein